MMEKGCMAVTVVESRKRTLHSTSLELNLPGGLFVNLHSIS